MLGDGSTTVTCLQRRAKGSANLPAPAPTSSSVVVGVTSCARRLTSISSVRRGSALKKGEKGSQRSGPVPLKADRIWCDCSRWAATRCFQASSADMLEILCRRTGHTHGAIVKLLEAFFTKKELCYDHSNPDPHDR